MYQPFLESINSKACFRDSKNSSCFEEEVNWNKKLNSKSECSRSINEIEFSSAKILETYGHKSSTYIYQ